MSSFLPPSNTSVHNVPATVMLQQANYLKIQTPSGSVYEATSNSPQQNNTDQLIFESGDQIIFQYPCNNYSFFGVNIRTGNLGSVPIKCVKLIHLPNVPYSQPQVQYPDPKFPSVSSPTISYPNISEIKDVEAQAMTSIQQPNSNKATFCVTTNRDPAMFTQDVAELSRRFSCNLGQNEALSGLDSGGKPVVRGQFSELDLHQFPWFHGRITRHESEHRLLTNAKKFMDSSSPNFRSMDGTYLVRESETSPGGYAIDVFCGHHVEHYKIALQKNKDTGQPGYLISGESNYLFDSIPHIVDYFSKEISQINQPSPSFQLCCRLIHPLPKPDSCQERILPPQNHAGSHLNSGQARTIGSVSEQGKPNSGPLLSLSSKRDGSNVFTSSTILQPVSVSAPGFVVDSSLRKAPLATTLGIAPVSMMSGTGSAMDAMSQPTQFKEGPNQIQQVPIRNRSGSTSNTLNPSPSNSKPIVPEVDVPVADLLSEPSLLKKINTEPPASQNRIPTEHSKDFLDLKDKLNRRIERAEDWLQDVGSIKVLEFLGKGEFGEVHKGELEQKRGSRMAFTHGILELQPEQFALPAQAQHALTKGAPPPPLPPATPTYVALKSLRWESARDPTQLERFLDEVVIMTKLAQHQNLVRLMGIVLTDQELVLPPQYPGMELERTGSEAGLPKLLLVIEYCSKGNLVDYLRSRGRSVISPADQLRFTTDACAGLEYLESQKIVHRDVAARNVLLDERLRGKISDFGLAREADRASEGAPSTNINQSDAGKFPVKWTAPEAIKKGQISNKSDVWSFGVLVWEIYAFGVMPYRRIQTNEVLNAVLTGYRMEIPERCPPDMYLLMKECWALEPANRPTFQQLHKRLKEMSKQHEPAPPSAPPPPSFNSLPPPPPTNPPPSSATGHPASARPFPAIINSPHSAPTSVAPRQNSAGLNPPPRPSQPPKPISQ